MKKFISILLSLLMILSCAAVPAFAAETSASVEGCPQDIKEMYFEGRFEDFYSFNMSLDYLYNGMSAINWSLIKKPMRDQNGNVIKDESGNVQFMPQLDENGDVKKDENGNVMYVMIEKMDAALVEANINMYLLRVLRGLYGGEKLFTGKNATAIANFIGNLISNNFPGTKIEFSSEPAGEAEFYKAISDCSGLGFILDSNWCKSSVNFKPLIRALGVNIDDLLDRELKNGNLLAEALLKTIVKRVFQQGPVNYVFSVVSALAETYGFAMLEPLKALLAGKLATGVISQDELAEMKGLFNLAFNNNNPADTSKLQFVTVPSYHFGRAEDNADMFIFAMTYLNILGRYRDNRAVINKLRSSVAASSELEQLDKDRIDAIIDGAFFGNTARIDEIIDEMDGESISDGTDQAINSVNGFFAKIIKAITDFFDKIYRFFTGANK